MTQEYCTSSYRSILREIQQENISIETIINFRKSNRSIPWTDVIYKQTGDTILHIAARLGQYDIVEYILLHWFPHNANVANNDNKTPLHEAAQFSQHKTIDILLQHGASVDALKKADWTPLMLACTKSGESAYLSVQYLLLSKASVRMVNKDGWSALHVACRTGDSVIIKLLLQPDEAVARTRTNNGRTILHIACLHGHLEVATLILERNLINIDAQDNCGNTPLHDGVCSGNIAVVKYLRASNCDVNVLNKANLSCLHLAASEGLLDMMKYLLCECRINPDIRSEAGLTPLHCAARKKQCAAYELLIQLGADPNISDAHGRTPEQYYKL